MTSPIGFILPAASIGLGALLIKPNQRGFYPNTKFPNDVFTSPLIAQTTIEETHHDELEITEHPIEYNAVIADHAFKRPSEVIIRCAWSNSPSVPGGLLGSALSAASGLVVQKTGALVGSAVGSLLSGVSSLSSLTGNAPDQVKQFYNKLLALQESRIPFDVFTGKRAYTGMLLRSLGVTTDTRSENALLVVAVCKQVIIVKTQVVAVTSDPTVQSQPQTTAAPINQGQQQLGPAPKYTAPPNV